MITKKQDNKLFYKIAELLPIEIVQEIENLCRKNGNDTGHINEIRLRAIGRCAVVMNAENFRLNSRIGIDEMRLIFKKVCDMAVFAHRDEIANGFVSITGGGRVGVCGCAKYDGGKMIGVSDITSLVFRIPVGKCDFADKLFRYWSEHGFCGMLICSKAGVGKTSAIRSLAAKAGTGAHPKRVVVVDERCEFDPDMYRDCTVDILKGYKRAKGIEIAIRTMSAEILVVDEIGNEEDSEALMLASGAGVSVLATAHGDDIKQIVSKRSVKRLYEASLFDSYAMISSSGGRREVFIEKFSSVAEQEISLL